VNNERYGIIYKITNTKNGKIYIGQTIRTLAERFRCHCKPCSASKKNGMPIAKAIQKYGKDCFVIEEIDTAKTKEELNKKEIAYIYSFESYKKNIGYNISSGGSNGNNFLGKTEKEMLDITAKISKAISSYWNALSGKEKSERKMALSDARHAWVSSLTEIDREKMSRLAKERFSGRPKSILHRESISKAKTGVRFSQKTIIKMASKKPKPNPVAYKYKKKENDSIKQPKKSSSKLGIKNPSFGLFAELNPKSIRIIATDLRNGQECEIFGIQEAARVLGVPATKICAVLKGRRRSSHGYSFRYKG
jgi:group I intron endonuclease